MIALLLRYWQVGAGMIAGALMVTPFVYLYSESITRKVVAVETLQKTIKIINDRSIINDQITSDDASSLCSSLGLSDADSIECLRRVQQTDAKP